MKGYPKHYSTHTQPARTLRTRLRICRNRISPPSLDVILTQVNCSDDQTRVNLREQFQVPGRTETGRGRRANTTQVRNLVLQVRCPRTETKHGTYFPFDLFCLSKTCSFIDLTTQNSESRLSFLCFLSL